MSEIGTLKPPKMTYRCSLTQVFLFVQGNHEIGGRHIDVKKAVSREEMGGGGGGRGGRGGGGGRVIFFTALEPYSQTTFL